MTKSAKERKRAAKAKSKEAVKKASHRSGHVVTYQRPVNKQKKQRIDPAFVPKMGKPKGLSAQARFEMLRPDCIHPWDWMQLFTEDESLWEAIAEEAIEAVYTGELTEYPIEGTANASRNRLRLIRNGEL